MTTTRSSVQRVAQAVLAERLAERSAEVGTRRTIVIERIEPQLDGGRHPVKRVVGDTLRVTADIFADGHTMLGAALLLRADDETEWREAPMRFVDNDRWAGEIGLERNRWHVYTIEAWRDEWGTWRDGLLKKVDAGVAVPSELAEGRLLLRAAAQRATVQRAEDDDRRVIEAALSALNRARSERTRVDAVRGEQLLAAMRRNPDRSSATRHEPPLALVVDREAARFGAWYELFPRSQGRRPGEATTL